jgi:hypothetical protein
MWQRKVAVSFVILSLGCTTLKPVEQPVPFLAMNRPNAVLLIGPDGQEIEVAGPRLQSDSLVGLFENEPFKIPLMDVKQLRAKQVDKQRTVLFVGALTAGVAAVITGIAIANADHGGARLDTSYKCPNQLCSVVPKRAATVTLKLPFLRIP